MRRRIETAFDRFIDAQAMSDAQVATMLRELEIDIAIDLNGYSGEKRTGILAHRPAPVQVNYLGFPGTMGAPFIDYIIADRMVIPDENRIYYSEQVVYLPHTYLPNDGKRPIAENTPSRIEAGLPETGFVFACHNAAHKIGPEMFDVWMRLLQTVEGSVLWLKSPNPSAMGNLRREAKARGVAPERLVFAPRLPQTEDHLARLRLADLFLDTLPYNAHATACDALWAGLPVLTCLGNTFPGRVAASLLHAIGLPELVTSSLAEYEELALALARNPERLAAIKAKLMRNRDTEPLFDTARFTRDLESAYTTMWERTQRGEPPETLSYQQRKNLVHHARINVRHEFAQVPDAKSVPNFANGTQDGLYPFTSPNLEFLAIDEQSHWFEPRVSTIAEVKIKRTDVFGGKLQPTFLQKNRFEVHRLETRNGIFHTRFHSIALRPQGADRGHSVSLHKPQSFVQRMRQDLCARSWRNTE